MYPYQVAAGGDNASLHRVRCVREVGVPLVFLVAYLSELHFVGVGLVEATVRAGI